MATAPLCNTTLDGTTPELSQEYLHETELLVTDLLWTWNPAGPAWNRPRICVQDLVKFHTHLMRFPQHDYQFNETQVLLAVIKRLGLQNDSDIILNWLHEEFLLHVEEVARQSWGRKASSEVQLLSEKITRLLDEHERTTLARKFDENNSSATHEESITHPTSSDNDNSSRNSTDHVQESGREVEDRDEKKFNELFAKAGDHAARIDALENKVSRLLSNASTPLAETSILGREENEQESSGNPGGDSEMSSVGMLTPDSTVRSSSPVPTPRPRRPILTLSVKGHNTNMLVRIGLNTPFRSLRQNLSRSRWWGLVELWHGNTQIMDTDTPKILGLEEKSLINIVVPVHRSDWIDESQMHFRNTFAA
ncbi:hypothetical protein KCV07_g2708, partial [Aureobasidium melanogenum]